MKNTPSQVSNSCNESPKTPGGISKSLLTPCRRVGLSRNWRSKGTISPFISPLGTSSSIDETQNELRKRKKNYIEELDKFCDNNTNKKQLKVDDQNVNLSLSCNTPTSSLNSTPSRLILKKKSKTLLLIQDNEVQNDSEQSEMICKNDSELNNSAPLKEKLEENAVQTASKVSNLLRLKTKNKQISNNETTTELIIEKENVEDKTLSINVNSNNLKELGVSNNNVNENNEQKSPNNLTKECIVVIQKNILKSISPNANTEKESSERNLLHTSCESDNDDIPLCNIGSKQSIKQSTNLKNNKKLIESKNPVTKIDKTTSVTDLNTKTKIKHKKSDKNLKFLKSKTPSKSSNCFDDDDDDDDFQIDKRTILIKKSYSKPVKPIKAKSTGSISQKDIDELRARIEQKKNLLMVKAMSNETEELRDLIKKWQHGCQTALTELLELIKTKMPGQNMDYSEILKMLKIPSDLIGYDSENDCFNTPDDKNIILSGFNLNKI